MQKLLSLVVLLSVFMMGCKSAEEKNEDQQVDEMIQKDQQRYDSLKRAIEE